MSLKRAAAELARRQALQDKFDPDAGLFGPQKAFVQDTAPTVLATCSRRAGKSYGIAWKFIHKGRQYPNALLPYVVQAREQAKDIIWGPLREMDEQFDLGLKFRENNGDVVLPNGATIKLYGAGSRREAEKLRGKKYPFVAIDEAQIFTGDSLRYLLEDIVEPATMDYGVDGQIYLTGTPNAACAGPFYDLWKSDGVSKHAWTLLENPHLPDPAGWLQRMGKKNGWNETHPTYLREYCGRWIRDTDGLVYKLNYRINVVNSPFEAFKKDADDWQYTLGVDFGVRSASAFTVVAHSLDLGKAYVVESFTRGGDKTAIPVSRIAATVDTLQRKYDLAKMIGDTGGMGRAITETLQHDYGIVMEAAKKSEKAAHITAMNSDLTAGVLKICRPQCMALIGEMEMLQWDEDRYESGVLKEDRRQANHAADSCLYAWRAGVHHDLNEWNLAGPKVGTKAWADEQDDLAFEKYLARQNELDAFQESASDFEEPLSLDFEDL